MQYLICYDLENDKQRTKLFRLMEGYGIATQLSLFICDLTPPEKQQLLAEAQPLLDTECDRFFIYPLCSHCVSSTRRSGDQQPLFTNHTIRVI